jgi:hypothetical protein
MDFGKSGKFGPRYDPQVGSRRPRWVIWIVGLATALFLLFVAYYVFLVIYGSR